MQHLAKIEVDDHGALVSIECGYDKADASRPCWPHSEEGTPDPAPQTICTWEQWADEAGIEAFASWRVSGIPVSCEWTGWDSPTFTLGQPADAAIVRAENAEREAQKLREFIEGKVDAYAEDGEPFLPRGWTLVDGGRLDELEAIERRAENAEALLRRFVDATDAASPTNAGAAAWQVQIAVYIRDARALLAGIDKEGEL